MCASLQVTIELRIRFRVRICDLRICSRVIGRHGESLAIDLLSGRYNKSHTTFRVVSDPAKTTGNLNEHTPSHLNTIKLDPAGR